jgi:MoxR-like ATPase
MANSGSDADLQAEIDAELEAELAALLDEPVAEKKPAAAPPPEPEPAPQAEKPAAPKREKSEKKVFSTKRDDRPKPPTDLFDDPVKGVEYLSECHGRILKEIGKVIVGQAEVIDQLLTAFFANGHCLLMGVPGLAKTLLVNTLSETMALDFHRIQFTPDLMPTDITGTNILQEDPGTRERKFVFREGPIFTNVLLADEINRTPPKTQAALLEAMQEKQVSNGRDIFKLPRPFLVLATQNPIEQEGTYTMPEAQMDRFIFLVKVDYASKEEELEILLNTTKDNPEKPQPILDGPTILGLQSIIRNIPVTEYVGSYALRLMRATRPDDPEAPDFVKQSLQFGCGPRAGQSLIMAAKAHAALKGRYNVSCDDIKRYALPVLRHRIMLNFAAVSEGRTADSIIQEVLEAVPEAE